MLYICAYIHSKYGIRREYSAIRFVICHDYYVWIKHVPSICVRLSRLSAKKQPKPKNYEKIFVREINKRIYSSIDTKFMYTVALHITWNVDIALDMSSRRPAIIYIYIYLSKQHTQHSYMLLLIKTMHASSLKRKNVGCESQLVTQQHIASCH